MKRMEPLSEQEIQKMIRAAFAESERDGVLLSIAAKHAVRAHELAKLDVSQHLNLKDGCIFIPRGKGSVAKREDLMPGEADMLRKYLNGRTDGLLFPSSKVGPRLGVKKSGGTRRNSRPDGALSSSQIYCIFRRYAELTNVPDASRSPHAFRHSLGQNLKDKGMDIATLQVVMGHKSIQSTMRYFTIKQSTADAEKARLLA